MDGIFLLLLIFLIPAIIIGSSIFLSFWLPKKLGFQKAGKVIGILVCCFFTYAIVYMIFEDKFFSKNDAIELLDEQKIYLNDDFKIEENHSTWAIGDYYHTFTLTISKNDKKRIIEEIKSSLHFKDITYNVIELVYSQEETPVGKRIVQNYETKLFYIREYFEENGKGYAPMFRKISIEKNKNKLIFEDIDL